MEKKNKFVLVLSLIMILSITSIGIKNGTSATPLIPTPDPPNENVYWDFDAGTFIGWNIEFYNGNTLMQRAEIIFNISALAYFNNYSGLGINYYGVQLKRAWFNATTNSLEERPYTVLNCSMANFTSGLFTGIASFYDYGMINPFIPINGTNGLMTEWCANEMTDDYSMYLGGDLNPDISTPNANTILFENSTGSGEYVKLVYYDNGTLETAVIFSYGDGYYPEGASYNYTRIFDFNPIDEVEWNVEIGDEFYMGFRHFEYKYVIVDFVNHSGYDWFSMLQPFQSVLADVYRWNFLSETWILQSENFSIATANEQWSYLIVTMLGEVMGGLQLLVPNGTTVDDMLTFFNYMMSMDPPDIELEYGADYIKLFNATSQEDLFYVEFTPEGAIEYIIHRLFWPVSDPYVMVYYNMNSEFISEIHNFNIEPYGTSDFQVAANITVSGDTHLLYAGLDYNPTNITLPNTVLVLNVFLNETNNLVGDINITITYDPVKYESLEVWAFNYTANGGMGAWEKIDFIQPVNGKIIISVDHLSLFALVGIIIDLPYTPPAAEEIPLEVIIIVSVIGGVVVIAVAVVISMRRKRK